MNNNFINDSQHLTTKELAKKYQVNTRTIRRWKEKTRNATGDNTGSIFSSDNKIYNDYIKLNRDKFIVIGDVEVPNHCAKTLNLALKIAHKFRIKTLVINGDFVALDCFSTWARTQVYKMAFKEELDDAVQVLKVFLNHFDEVIWITGNHESRLAKKVDGHITIHDFFVNFGNIKMSEYAYCIVKSNDKDIMITHQQNYSKRPLAVPYEMAAIKLMNMICAHTHHLAFGYDRSGRYWVVDGGHCRDVKQTRYKSINSNTHPEWNAGFCFVIDGMPYLVDHNNSDFWLQVKV